MTELNRTELRERIEKEIVKTEKAVKEYREMVSPVSPDNAIGRVSRMDAIVNNSVTESALRQAEEKLDQLKYMLNRVDEPSFGLCSRCKNPIPVQRLILMPQSSLCVHCAARR